MKRVFLDTNSYSKLFKGDKSVDKEITRAKVVHISVITLGELLLGFKRGSKEKENLQHLKDFLKNSKINVANVKSDTAKIYSEISFLIRKQGTPLPVNDVWIASQVLETDSTLITYDSHFLKTKGLKVWSHL